MNFTVPQTPELGQNTTNSIITSSIQDIPSENKSAIIIEKLDLSSFEQAASEQPIVILPTTPATVQHSTTSFPSLIEFWKFLLKIFLLTIILLISAYLIIRTLLWLIESTLRPGGASPPGSE